MQLAPATAETTENIHFDLECLCGEACIVIQSNQCDGDDIYFCKECEKNASFRGKKYCAVCGPMTHSKKSKKKHSFDTNSKDVVLLKNILESKENDDHVSVGRRALRAMIGLEKFNQIEPFLDKCPSLTSVGVGGVSLAVELVAQFSADATKKMVFSNVSIASGIGVGIIGLCELGYLGYQWKKNNISGRELLRLSGKTIVKNGALWGGVVAGNYVGAFAGAKVGALAGAWAGPAGLAVGVGVGLVAGFFLGLLAGKCASAAYDRVFPPDQTEKKRRETEQLMRKKMIHDALIYFHYQPNDVENGDHFNKKELRKRFKKYALEAHPDRRNGDHTEWGVLSVHYGILTALCEEKTGNKDLVVKKILALTVV